MTANDVFEYFSQDPTAAPWKFQDIKFGIVWRIYMGMPHEACWGGFEKKNLHWLDEWLRNQKGIDRSVKSRLSYSYPVFHGLP